MCLLNGEVGGQLFASIDFGTEESVQTTEYSIDTSNISNSAQIMEKICYYKDDNVLIKVIQPSDAFNSVANGFTYTPNTYFYEAKENTQYYVRDSGSTATVGRTYYSLKALYEIEEMTIFTKIPLKKIIREAVHTYAQEPYHNIMINDLDNYGLEQVTYQGDKALYAFRDPATNDFTQIVTSFTEPSGTFNYDNLSNIAPSADTTLIDGHTVAKIEPLDDIGYRLTDLTYNGDLISSIGDSVTSILDKIKNMLGDFEYFYDVDGHFIFQHKPNYLTSQWNQITNNENETYITDANLAENKFSYTFTGNTLFTAIQNTPVLTNVRNDFIVWGKRTTASGAEIPIHARYAIDQKPTYYKAFNGIIYQTQPATDDDEKQVDWREIIYQMALDYFAHQTEENFLLTIATNNPDYYPTGKTGYEQYYTDMQGFWRELYNPEISTEPNIKSGTYVDKIEQGSSGYYTRYKEWEPTYEADENDNTTWNTAITTAPDTLNFWIDFLEPVGELAKFSIPAIGDRPKVVNEDKATAIVFKEIPNIILYNSLQPNISTLKSEIMDKGGYTFVSAPEWFMSYLRISSRSLCVKDKIDELLYKHTYCTENISLTSIPIYYLQPNTRIYIQDNTTQINGEYIVSRITLPLTYNGTMSITASKAPPEVLQ